MNLLEKELEILDDNIIRRNKLKEIIKRNYPHYKEVSINWVIYKLVKNKVITKLNNNEYIIGYLKEFKYEKISDTSLDLINKF